MQELQERLLGLLKEIDAICSENAITYYCSGGTVIGAARHEGFIPWDDDIDICMMREDFERFREVFRSSPPEGRFLLCNEDYPDYHSTIPRYVEADSTSFCRYHLLGEVPAGVSLDIFILEPVPDEPELQREFIRKFFLYSDFVMPFYCFSHRVPSEHLGELADLIRKKDELGEAAVIEDLRAELFTGGTRSSGIARGSSDRGASHGGGYRSGASGEGYVCLLWASSPSIFPKSIFGTPTRLPFEDTEICVPGDWYQYLVLEYGMNWRTVPYSEVHESHITINRLGEPYARCYEVRDSLYNRDELLKLFYERKLRTVEYERLHRRLVDARSKIKADAVRAALDNRLAAESADPLTLCERGEYGRVLEIFRSYLDVQLSRWLIGSRTRFHYYRYMYPTIIELPEAYIDAVLRALLHEARFGELKKLLDIFEKAGCYEEVTDYAAGALAYVQDAEREYYYGNYEQCLLLCGECFFDELRGYVRKLSWLCRAVTKPVAAISQLSSTAAESAYAGDVMYEKALADAYFNTGNRSKAERLYSRLLRTTRDGMIWKDIMHKTGQSSGAIDQSAPYSPDRLIALEEELLGELTDICAAGGIGYVLAPETAAKLASDGNLGYRADRKTVYMTIENARRFLKICSRENGLPEDRVILTRGNSPYIRDLVLEYAIKDSVSVNLRDIGGTAGRGIGITIRVLRSGSPYSPVNIWLRLKEKGGSFGSIMELGSGKAGGDLYYYINKPGKRPVRKLVKSSVIEDTVLLNAGSREFRVPASVLKKCGNKEGSSGDGKADKKAGTDKRSIPENIFYSEDLSPDELLVIAGRSGIGGIDMAAYERAAAASREADAAVDNVWEAIVRRESETR